MATIVNADRDEGMFGRIEKLNNRSRNQRHPQPSRDRKAGGMRTHRLATPAVFDLDGLRLPQNVRRWSLGLRLDRRGGFGSEQRIQVGRVCRIRMVKHGSTKKQGSVHPVRLSQWSVHHWTPHRIHHGVECARAAGKMPGIVQTMKQLTRWEQAMRRVDELPP